MSNKALFLDRDGVINVDKHHVYRIEDCEFVDGIFDLCRKAKSEGYLIIVVTNQAGIAKGKYTEEDYFKFRDYVHKEFEKQGCPIDGEYYCPYHTEAVIEKYRQDSYDRKPNPGMILKAQKDFDIDLSQSILIGDKESDIEAGKKAGVGNLKLKEDLMNNQICKTPFYTAEIFSNGDVFCCCPAYIKSGPIGNIFQTSWDEIWNSENAKNFRKHILQGDYSLCKSNFCDSEFFPLCHELKAPSINQDDFKNNIIKPKIIKISTDISCNVMCTLCRTEFHCNDDIEHTKLLDSKIDTIFIPMLKDVEIVNFTGSGDPFASKHFRKLIKRIAEIYPNIKFDLHTNGLLCDEANLKELGILNRLSTIQISLHSASKDIYDQIVLKGNWVKLNKNLEFIKQLLEQNKLFELHLNFVITSKNYKDIPAFIDLCNKYQAKAFLWNYRDLMFNGLDYDETNICSPIHRNHKQFIEIITSEKIRNAKNIFMSPLIKKFAEIKNIEEYCLYSAIMMYVISERYDDVSKYSVKKLQEEQAQIKYYGLGNNILESQPVSSSKIQNNFLENIFL